MGISKRSFKESLSDLGICSEILNFDNSELTLNEHGLERRIPNAEISNCVEKLTILEKYKGFNSLRTSLNNPTQFVDTMFEINCMYAMVKKKEVIELEISPEIIIENKTKRPDFRFVVANGGEFFCECKSLASVHRIKNSVLMRFFQELEPYLSDIINNSFRIEIAFNALPPHWNRNYCEQIASSIKVLIEKEILEKLTLTFEKGHETYIKLCYIDEKPYFKCLISLGNKPPLKNPTLIIGEMKNLKKDIRASIKDALTQLPSNKASIVYLNSLNENDAKHAITGFFANYDIRSLCGIFSWTTSLNYYDNPNSMLKLYDYLSLI